MPGGFQPGFAFCHRHANWLMLILSSGMWRQSCWLRLGLAEWRSSPTPPTATKAGVLFAVRVDVYDGVRVASELAARPKINLSNPNLNWLVSGGGPFPRFCAVDPLFRSSLVCLCPCVGKVDVSKGVVIRQFLRFFTSFTAIAFGRPRPLWGAWGTART